MSVISFLISGLLLFASIYKRDKKVINPITVFYALWTFILFLSMLNLYDIVKPSDEAYLLIVLMLVFFALGNYSGMIIGKIKNKFNIETKNNEQKNSKENNNEIKPLMVIIYILCIITIILNIVDCIIVIKSAVSGTPMWQIRNWSLEPVGSDNPLLSRRTFLEETFRTIISSPLMLIIYSLAAYNLFNSNNKKQKYITLGLSVLLLITNSIAGAGGRLGFICYCGAFLLQFYISWKNGRIPKDKIKKYKKLIVVLLIAGVVAMVAYTILRAGTGKVFKQIYTYFALPPTLLSLWLPELKAAEHTFGLLTTFGIHSYFFRGLGYIGLNSIVPSLYQTSYQHILNAEVFRNVGYGVGNAFVTPIYYFFLDGGYPFVCIASCIFGVLVSKKYRKIENNMNEKTFVNYYLIMYGIFISFMRIQTAIPSYAMAFILVAILFRKQKVNIIKDGEEHNEEK